MQLDRIAIKVTLSSQCYFQTAKNERENAKKKKNQTTSFLDFHQKKKKNLCTLYNSMNTNSNSLRIDALSNDDFENVNN